MLVVLDAWPLLEMLEGAEPVSTQVVDLIEDQRPTVSWINLGEVYYIVRRRRGARTADEVLHRLSGVVVAELPTAERVVEAATIKAGFPLSFADAFAAATAIAHRAELWTGDPELLRPGTPWRWRDLRP